MFKNNSRNKLLIIAGLAILTLAVSVCARLMPHFPGDLRLTILLQSFNNESLQSFMEWVSFLTGGWRAALLVVVIGVVVWWRLGRLEGILILVAGLSSSLNIPLKVAINRPRPAADMVRVFIDETGNGFPSGHALFAAVVLGLLAYFVGTNLRKRSLRILSLFSLLVLILLVGASRVYLGAHWPSDVMGGYLFGALFIAVLIWFYDKRKAHLSAASASRPEEGND